MHLELPDFVLPIVYLILFALIILRTRAFRAEGLPVAYPLTAFGLKAVAGLAMFLLYTYYYKDRQSADIFRLYDDSLRIWEMGKESVWNYLAMVSGIGDGRPEVVEAYRGMNNWYPGSGSEIFGDSRFLIRFHAVAMIFSGGNYHVHYLLAGFISFSGGLMIWKGFNALDSRYRHVSFFIIFLLPSTLFWTSGVLKESFILTGIGLILYSLSKIQGKGWTLKGLVFLLAGLCLLYLVRPYVFILALILVTVSLLLKRLSLPKAAGAAVLAGILVILADITGLIGISDLIHSKQAEFIASAQSAGAGSIIAVPAADSGFNLLTSLPHALFNAILQPNLFNSRSLIEWIPAVEMLVFLLAAAYLLRYFSKPEQGSFWLFLILLSLAGLIAIGFTVPVAGAIVRYRSVYLPLLLLGLLHSSEIKCRMNWKSA